MRKEYLSECVKVAYRRQGKTVLVHKYYGNIVTEEMILPEDIDFYLSINWRLGGIDRRNEFGYLKPGNKIERPVIVKETYDHRSGAHLEYSKALAITEILR